MKLRRQGDVVLFHSDLPEDVVKYNAEDAHVLAYGEATGHCHQLKGDFTVYVSENGSLKYVKVGRAGATLVHEEHKPHTLEPNEVYEVKIQREYQPEGRRRVLD